MTTIRLALLALAPYVLGAGVITQTVTLSNPVIVGDTIHFSGVFTVNRFDQSLGTLDSVDLTVLPFGTLIQDVTYPSTNMGTLDYTVSGPMTFMGITKEIYTTNPSLACINPGPCVQLGELNPLNSPTTVTATLTPNLWTFRDYQFGPRILAQQPGDLAMFFGASGETLTLPFDMNLVARTVGSTTSVLRQQQGGVGVRLTLVQNYTQTAAAVPEPRYVAGMSIVFVGLVLAGVKPK